ncbi:glyoxalase/bleomycin resistance/dioxygenase family protein, partial [Bacillus subtilis]|uniref:glyoxalase/bleomycin resistance/dioxygenase family protein n=1 Tax=Bacillus subtilis TaxID=1423 RepID=UPI001BA8AE50
MITHYADLELQTVSIQGVKQAYADRLQLPILHESRNYIRFQLTPFTTLSFKETYEAIYPVHFAIQVPYSQFIDISSFIRQSGLFILKQENGQYIDETNGRKNLYFRDGDGNLLEIIAHEYIKENQIELSGNLKAMYLREIGFPVKSVPIFREWLKNTLKMKTERDQDTFNFVISGTAHAVVVSKERPWIPISMKALPPKMLVTLGTTDMDFMNKLTNKLDNIIIESDKIYFSKVGYNFFLFFSSFFFSSFFFSLYFPL